MELRTTAVKVSWWIFPQQPQLAGPSSKSALEHGTAETPAWLFNAAARPRWHLGPVACSAMGGCCSISAKYSYVRIHRNVSMLGADEGGLPDQGSWIADD